MTRKHHRTYDNRLPGHDLFTREASALFHVPYESVTPEQLHAAKVRLFRLARGLSTEEYK